MKRFTILILTVLLTASLGTAYSAGKNSSKINSGVSAVKPDKATVLDIAAACIKKCEPKLKDQDKAGVDQVKAALEKAKDDKDNLKELANDFVNQYTLALASLKSYKAILTGSAYLVQYLPGSQRTTNLFGCVLNADTKNPESKANAVLVFEYALSIKPETRLVRLNLANAYIDVDKLDKAKPILDKLVFEDSEDRSAWRAMATYYYKKKDLGHFREALLRAAKFKGYVKSKSDKKNKKVQDNQVQTEDPIPVIERKLAELEKVTPFTTADVLEDDFPDEAKLIREKYGLLIDNEKLIMPKLPQVNMNGNKEYIENYPVIEAWIEAQTSKMEKWTREMAKDKYDINPGDSDEVISAKAQAGAAKDMAKAMQQAKDAMDYLKNVPGMEGKQDEIDRALRELQNTGKRTQINGKSIAPDLKDNPVDLEKTPGFDNGTPFAQMNYSNYYITAMSYEKWMVDFFQDYTEKAADIYEVYSKKIQEENDFYEENMKELDKEHSKEMEFGSGGWPHTDGVDAPCRKEEIRHKKAINSIGLDYYHQWSNLYCPQYTQKMKPTIDAYWKTCALYIKNMNDPEIMQREYIRVRGIYMFYAMQATAGIGGGKPFEYIGPTDEEEAQLEADIEAAQKEAEERKPEFEKQFKEPGIDWTKWIEDHLVVSISIEVLKLKVTARTIEFEAYVPGAVGGFKIDMIDSKLETYVGNAIKNDWEINLFGMGAKIEGRVDFTRRTAKWDFEKGTYTESYDTTAGEGKLKFGPLNASGKVQLDYDAELTAKADYKFGVDYKVPLK